MAAQQGGPVVLCIGKKSVKHDQLSLDVKGVHLKNELPSFVDQWGKVDWETVVLETVVVRHQCHHYDYGQSHGATLFLKPLKVKSNSS